MGPLTGIYTTEGIEARKQWWRDILAGGDYDGKVEAQEVDDNRVVAELVERLQNEPTELVWIWAAQNKHDVSGYYWLMSQLKDFQGRLYILYLNNLPFINEKGLIFYPEWLHVIPPKEFLKAKKLARPITLSEFEVDPDEWTKLTLEDKGVRLLEGGKKLSQQDYAYYDADLKNILPTIGRRLPGSFTNSCIRINKPPAMRTSSGASRPCWRLVNLMYKAK